MIRLGPGAERRVEWFRMPKMDEQILSIFDEWSYGALHIYEMGIDTILRIEIETQRAFPGESAKAATTLVGQFGKIVGLAKGLCHRSPFLARSEVEEVPNADWRMVALPGRNQDKAAAVQRAVKLFPDMLPVPVTKREDGPAEALLIAAHGIHEMFEAHGIYQSVPQMAPCEVLQEVLREPRLWHRGALRP